MGRLRRLGGPDLAYVAALRRAARAYAVDRTYTSAAQAAGVTAQTVTRWAKTDPRWSALVAAEAEMAKRVSDVTLDRVIIELGAIAFADIRDVVQWDVVRQPTGVEGKGGRRKGPALDVTLRPSHQLTPEQARAVEAVEVTPDGRVRVKLASKVAALGKLAEILTLSGRQTDPLTAVLDLVAQRRRERMGAPENEPIDVTPVVEKDMEDERTPFD